MFCTDIQLAIYEKCPHEELTIIMRRYMMKIAQHFENEDQEKYWMIRITINLSKNHLNSFWHKNVGTIDEISESQDIMQFDFSESETSILSLNKISEFFKTS